MIEVSAAIFISNSKVFCVKKGKSKYDYLSNKYEFPGGKIENGETAKEALVREISEELGSDISQVEIMPFCDTFYDYPDFTVLLHFFIVKLDYLSFKLTEHADYMWSSKNELEDIDWAAADKVIIGHLKEIL